MPTLAPVGVPETRPRAGSGSAAASLSDGVAASAADRDGTAARGSLPRVLSIAGTDPTGGAGIQADLKSITAAGGYGMSVVTALVAQNTHGVRSIHTPDPEFLTEQLNSVSDDVTIDAVKTGMLATTEIIAAVSAWVEEQHPRVLVVDPVMVASSGDRLLDTEAEEAMRTFCARATVITPNLHELAVLTQEAVATDAASAVAQAQRWAERTGVSVIVKTGHLESAATNNLWVSPDGTIIDVPSTRVNTTNTHGTGCSLSSALATLLGSGNTPESALTWATRWLREAIGHGSALRVGSGNGPVDHGHRLRRLGAAGTVSARTAADVVPPMLDDPAELAAGVTPAAFSIAPAGPWTAALWRAGSNITRQVHDGDFVAQLVSGTLPQESFSFYLAQDALYLATYSRALALVAATAQDPAEGAFWASGSAEAHLTEAELHRSWLGGTGAPGAEPNAVGAPSASEVTSAYVDFLLARAATDGHVVGAAAVLPCYWLYAEVGAAIPTVSEDHPYAAWLGTYADPAFMESTRTAVEHVERLLDSASPSERAAAARAYLTACWHEAEFFDQALRVDSTLDTAEPEAAR
ncbi:MAG: bifunctional hydroxymethylpyrimidine kinase/phosphomethylpyrimidine kinase [Galactobacter sp.]|uniref:bifunctional hydroxymethylpyrimidine kinase/phosphomethylpyrimidine kinase n=1 Tax=Galactobacter sp. TaxID=2676125 RepID=UPI0025C44800|nr:bifunctional hydroxymethylpyrimidine kinase/phosphomethylpyrimidine kinase [Galactobacter sp.]